MSKSPTRFLSLLLPALFGLFAGCSRPAPRLDGEVLREDGSTVPGLFAIGGCASNIAQDGTGYSSGTCIGESTFFGRRAGLAAAG